MKNKLTLFNKTTTECHTILKNFVNQDGDNGAKLLSILTQYINTCHFKMHPISKEDQQDILQNVCIKIIQNHEKLNGHCYSWLYNIVKNTFIDHLRQQQRYHYLVKTETNNDILFESHPDHGNQNPCLYNETDCLEAIFNQIEQQPTGKMDIKIYTGFALGYSRATIALQTGRTITAITKRLSKLRQLVKQLKQNIC